MPLPSFTPELFRYSPDFTARLARFPHPIAIVPPAIERLAVESVSQARLTVAFSLLGFSRTFFVSDFLYEVSRDLVSEAAASERFPLLFSACPRVLSFAREEFPELLDRFSRITPPADRAVANAREKYPDATLFFVSPCSCRAEALSSVDFAVPLNALYPALRDSVARAEVSRESVALENRASDVSVVASIEASRAFLQSLSSGNSPFGGVNAYELIACEGGCSMGDWAPNL